MKKIILSLMLVSFLTAEETKETQVEPIEIEVQENNIAEAPPQRKMKSSDMQNWLFAAGSIVCATAAIVVVSLNQGSSP